MLLKNYIKEILVLERNQPNLLKKALPYDLLIADISNVTMSYIYVYFQNEALIDSFLGASTGNADVSYDVSHSVENNAVALSESQFSFIKLKKNNKTIKHLKDRFGFDFDNCNLNDNKSILCIPADALKGDDSNITSQALADKRINGLLKNQAVKDIEAWNWAAHDLHHGETAISTDGDRFIDTNKISSNGLSDYSAPQTGYSYMDSHAPVKDKWPHGTTNKGEKIRNYWMALIGFYFNKIGFTRGVTGNDIWASVYAYCLTKMSSKEDAYEIDFKIVNEPGKRTLIVGQREIRKLQDFFANAYTTVHNYSFLSNLEDDIICIANMF